MAVSYQLPTVFTVARTVKGRDRFQFRIILVPPDHSTAASSWVGSCRWKHRAIHLMKMYLSIQAKKALSKANHKWYKFYWVYGYGAPLSGEFICPYSGMVAKTINQREAMYIRRYWVECSRKTSEVLEWINKLDPQKYTAELNHYLRRMIILPPNMRELMEYEAANPFKKPRQWQEL